MDKKILAIMVALVVIAAVVVVGVALAASGGVGSGKAGGFTSLFDKLEKADVNETYNMHLELPQSWNTGDRKDVSDKIVDMSFSRNPSTHIYTTNLWFAYSGDKWNNPTQGTSFIVPQESGDLHVVHGLFVITVYSATNLSSEFDNGDVITLTSTLTIHDADLVFGDWAVPNTR